MNQEVQVFVNALREQFGDGSVLTPTTTANVAASILFTSPDRSVVINFKSTPGDIVPVRATDVSRQNPVDPGAAYHLAKANIRTGGMIRLAFLNGVDGGEDGQLARAIEVAESEIRSVHE